MLRQHGHLQMAGAIAAAVEAGHGRQGVCDKPEGQREEDEQTVHGQGLLEGWVGETASGKLAAIDRVTMKW
jgi:hypothetical protein